MKYLYLIANIVMFAVTTGLIVLAIVYGLRVQRDCTNKGGVLVRGIGVACVKAETLR